MYTKGQLERSLSPSVVPLSLQEPLNDLGWNKKINKKKKIGNVNRRKRHSAWWAAQRVLQPYQKVSVRTQETPSVNQQKRQSAAGRLVTRSYKFILLPSLKKEEEKKGISAQSCLSEGWGKVSYNMSGVNIYSDGEMTGNTQLWLVCPASFFHLQTNENWCAIPVSSSRTCVPFFSPDKKKKGGGRWKK